MTEQEWFKYLQKVSKGEQHAFQKLYEQTRIQVYRTVSLLVNSKEDAEDVTSEVYAQLLRSAASFDGSRPFRAWLNGIIANQCSSWNRKLWRKWRLLERTRQLVEPSVEDDAQKVVQSELRSELIALVRKLPFKMRSVIVLRYFRDCSFEEIAETLQIPLGTAKSRHHAALGKLRKHSRLLNNEPFEEEPAHVYSTTN